MEENQDQPQGTHKEAHLHNEPHMHHPGHGAVMPQKGNNQMPWMVISIFLAILLVVVLFFYISLANSLIKGGAAAPTQPSAPSQPSAPPEAEFADIKLTASDHVRGSKDAPVIIVEYSDFQCPFCSRAVPTVDQVIKTYGDKVAIVYRHFPLSFHENARPAAIASECAGEQNKFWEFHDKLFANQESLGEQFYINTATELKLNVDKFTTCIKTEKFAQKVDGDFAQGQTDGVSGTPTFFINGKKLGGAQPFAAFKPIIDAELA